MSIQERFVLFREDGVLKLKDLERPKYKPIYIDFGEYLSHWDHQKSSLKNALLAKAIGFKGEPLTVWDSTLGLAKDAFFFCLLGCKVTGTERSETIFSLLKDALERAKSDKKVYSIVENLEIYNCDALEIDKDNFDVIYIDPMYPDTKSSAAPQASMQILRDLLVTENNIHNLIDFAQKKANLRVVIKRPPKARPVDRPLIHSYSGKSVRYDAYRPSNRTW
ncbi:MAG: hypothetical protein A4S09_09660 [Proteobacteria bacterium SG_bin7]|nr:MAG: hypothetical protein A4S09_09660 [Proteobacteria bacterium SG_bin7]